VKNQLLKYLLERKIIVNSKFQLVRSLLDTELYEFVFYNDKQEKIHHRLFREDEVSVITIDFDTVSAFITFKE